MSNLIHQLYFLNIPLDVPELKTLITLTLFESWAMAPNKFDYSIFQPGWLLAIDDSILERMSSIPTIGERLHAFLIADHHPQLSTIYFRFFAKKSTQ